MKGRGGEDSGSTDRGSSGQLGAGKKEGKKGRREGRRGGEGRREEGGKDGGRGFFFFLTCSQTPPHAKSILPGRKIRRGPVCWPSDLYFPEGSILQHVALDPGTDPSTLGMGKGCQEQDWNAGRKDPKLWLCMGSRLH